MDKKPSKKPKKPLVQGAICTNCGLPMKEHLNQNGKCDLDPAVKDRR